MRLVDAVLYGEAPLAAPVSSTLLLTGYQSAYGDIYSSPTQVFEAQYAG